MTSNSNICIVLQSYNLSHNLTDTICYCIQAGNLEGYECLSVLLKAQQALLSEISRVGNTLKETNNEHPQG